MSEYELKPCPFCGCAPYVGYDGTSWIVACRSGICIPMPSVSMSEKEKAFTIWNTRAGGK